MLIPFPELFARHSVRPDGVLHLGANTGQEAEIYHRHKIPQVVWVEALPHVCAQLRRHIVEFPGQMAIEACVSDVDGAEVEFHEASNQGQSSSLLALGTHKKDHPTVHYIRTFKLKTVRVDTLLAQRGILLQGKYWFLNVDLQGAELLALRGMGDLLLSFKWSYIEVNSKEVYQGCPLVGEIDRYLASFGLAGLETKMTGAGWGDKFYARK